MSEVKRHWPEDVVGTGEQYVLASDFDATEAARVKAEAECERLRGEVAELDAPACGGIGFDYSIKTATSDSIGKPTEPAGEVQLRTGGGISLLHVELAQPLPPGTKLYTAPQPAPAQDVEGMP